MTAIRISDVGLELGAAVTISDLDAALAHAIDTMDPLKTIFFKEFRQQIRRFAGNVRRVWTYVYHDPNSMCIGHSVRNVGSIGGNLITVKLNRFRSGGLLTVAVVRRLLQYQISIHFTVRAPPS